MSSGSEKRDCQHENFTANVNVQRLLNDSGVVHAWSADIRVKCAECGEDFTFSSLPLGISSVEARVSIDGTELRLPLKPKSQQHFSFCPGFNVRQTA